MALALAPTQPRAAIYCRVSTPGQEQDGTSLGTQEERDRSHAEARGYTVDESYIYREVFTGTELWQRPKLTALRDAIRRGLIDVVVVYAIDRLARDPVHLGVLLSEAEYAGVLVEFVTEPLDDSPEGQLIRFVRGYAAKVEHEKIKERSQRGKLARLQAGKPLPGPRPPYGYRYTSAAKHAYEIDPVTGPVVQRIFAAHLAGQSLRAISWMLTDEGIPTATGRAPAWNLNVVRWILQSPCYTGRATGLRFQRTKIKGQLPRSTPRPESEHIPLPEGIFPPLVDEETFAAVGERLHRNKAQAARRNHNPEATLLRAGFIRCGYCGYAMGACQRRGGWHYMCARSLRDRDACPRPFITANMIDTAVWTRVEAVLTKPDVIAGELARLHQEDPTTADLQTIDRALAEIVKKQSNLARALALLDDDAASAPLVAELQALSNHKRSYEAERATILTRRAAWTLAQDRLADLTRWCTGVAAKLGDLGYQERRLALEALGVSVQVFKADHTPRYIITANLPLDATVSRTASGSAIRAARPRRWPGAACRSPARSSRRAARAGSRPRRRW
jgi:site-specific DNA recombinase